MPDLIYLDHTYQVLERVNLNQHKYIFALHLNRLEYLEHSEGMTYIKPKPEDFKNSKDLTYVAEQYLLTQFQRDVEAKINGGQIHSLDELKDTMKNFKTFAEQDPKLHNLMQVNQNMSLSDPKFMKMVTEMIQYYESRGIDRTPLELENAKKVDANDKEYIQHVDQQGNVSVVENNSVFGVKEEYERRKDDIKDLSKESGSLNADTIFKDMEQSKIGVHLEQAHQVNKQELNTDEKERMNTVEQTVDDEVLYDPINNIYYNARTQEVLTTEQKDGMIAVKRTSGTNHETMNDGTIRDEEFDAIPMEEFQADCLLAEEMINQMSDEKKDINVDELVSRIVNKKAAMTPEQRREYQSKLSNYVQFRMEKLRELEPEQKSMGGYQYQLKPPTRTEVSGYATPVLLGMLVGLTLFAAPVIALLFQA